MAGEAGWDICRDALDSQYPETVFPAAVLALEREDENSLQAIVEALDNDLNCAKALVSALGWLTYEQAEPKIEKLLADKSAFCRYIGMAASAIQRQDPGQHLKKAADDVYPPLIARALRAYGEVGRGRELDNYNLSNLLADSDDGIRFAAAWSGALGGNATAREILKSFVTPDSPYSVQALNTDVRLMGQPDALSWHTHLADSPATIRFAVIGAGIIGDSALIPWLIEQMKVPELARVAGEAFSMITGIDHDGEEMNAVRPDGFAAGPTDDPDDDSVALDVDENLPWPNLGLISVWWDNNAGRFPSGTRHLLGKPVTLDHLRHVLATGLQRQRSAAALELAIKQPGQPLFNVRARGCRQLGALGTA